MVALKLPGEGGGAEDGGVRLLKLGEYDLYLVLPNLEAIVLFGGLARSKEFLYEPMMKAMNDNVLKIWKDKVKIVFSQLKESDAAILGASALAWEL